MWAGVFQTNTTPENKKRDGVSYDPKDDDSETLYFSYAVECSDWEYIYSKDINEWLSRYSMHLQGIFSYGNVYDVLPVIWIQVLKLLHVESQEAQQAKARIDGNKKPKH